MRHGLVVVLTATVCAVAAGARSLVAIAEWGRRPVRRGRRALGTDRRCPSESTIRRLLGRVDADRLDGVLGGFVQRLCAGATPAARRRVLAMVSDAATREGLTKLGDNLV